ncbi:MAG: DUF1579 domain-containing protein [Gemmatimonadota bacterium]
MAVETREQHRWLERMVGEWTFESESVMEPGGPPVKYAGTENVRSLDGVWVVCEGRGAMPGGDASTSIMTLGYDPERERFVGTFVGSMMTHLWIYDGELDAAGEVLTLEAEGPGFTDQTRMAKYRDRIEFRSADQRVMTSSYQDDAGEWHEFMTTRYRRAT